MPAKIIETATDPLKRVKIDPITLDLIESALRNARVEMDATLFRTAMSPGIREQGDAFPMIADAKGRMIVGQFGSFLDGFLRAYNGTIEEGDVILLNDPYSCEGAISHLSDQLVMTPVYRNGRLIAWGAMFGHMTDVGGKVPGSLPTDAESIFEEGLRLPPVKLYKKGELQEDILNIACSHSRMPEWYRADLHAIVAACRMAGRRVSELCERFGEDVFNSATEELLARNHRAMKYLISSAIGEDPVSFEDYLCDDGKGNGPFKIKCTMWREGEKVILDFDGTDPQSDSSI
ncbi:MAG: hydantoinase B/oxoprolinase family protein, partial [Pseudomonadota bacterium]